MLDFNFEEKLKKFVLENKPEGSLDVHISCSISGMINITDNYCEDLTSEYDQDFNDLKEEKEDLEVEVEDLKDKINDLEEQVSYLHDKLLDAGCYD